MKLRIRLRTILNSYSGTKIYVIVIDLAPSLFSVACSGEGGPRPSPVSIAVWSPSQCARFAIAIAILSIPRSWIGVHTGVRQTAIQDHGPLGGRVEERTRTSVRQNRKDAWVGLVGARRQMVVVGIVPSSVLGTGGDRVVAHVTRHVHGRKNVMRQGGRSCSHTCGGVRREVVLARLHLGFFWPFWQTLADQKLFVY